MRTFAVQRALACRVWVITVSLVAYDNHLHVGSAQKATEREYAGRSMLIAAGKRGALVTPCRHPRRGKSREFLYRSGFQGRTAARQNKISARPADSINRPVRGRRD